MFNFVPSVIATIQNYDLKLRIICCDYLKKKMGLLLFYGSLDPPPWPPHHLPSIHSNAFGTFVV